MPNKMAGPRPKTEEEFALPPDLTPEDAFWLNSFVVSLSGNLTRQGCLTDPETKGGTTMPYRLNVFRNKVKEKVKWTWAIVLNPSRDKEVQTEQDYSNIIYDTPHEAALGAKVELSNAGFVISDEPPLVSILRSRFREYAQQ